MTDTNLLIGGSALLSLSHSSTQIMSSSKWFSGSFRLIDLRGIHELMNHRVYLNGRPEFVRSDLPDSSRRVRCTHIGR